MSVATLILRTHRAFCACLVLAAGAISGVLAQDAPAPEAEPSGASAVQPTPEAATAFGNALTSSLRRIEQEEIERRRAVERQFAASAESQPQSEVRSRAVPSRAARMEAGVERAVLAPAPTGESAAATRPLADPVATVPAIAGLSVASGRYQDQVWITGSAFGDNQNGTQREVHFVMNGQDVLAPINGYWTDTKIAVRVPKIGYVAPGPAEIYVVSRGMRSNPYPFHYVPELGTRIYMLEGHPPGTRLDRGFHIPVGTWPGPAMGGKTPTGGVSHRNFDVVVGHKGDDEFFRGVTLTHGWVLEDVVLATFYAQNAGAYVGGFNKGSAEPIVSVRWWTDAFVPLAQQSQVAYTMAVVLKGPIDLPDGWVVR